MCKLPTLYFISTQVEGELEEEKNETDEIHDWSRGA